MKATFATDKHRPGSYLARVEVTPDESWPLPDETIKLTRKDGSTADVVLGKVVWSGPDGEKPGIEVALFTIAKSLDDGRSRLPPGVKPKK